MSFQFKVPGYGPSVQGADIALLTLDANGPEMMFMVYDPWTTGGGFRYVTCKNLNSNGEGAPCIGPVQVAGVGPLVQDAGMAATNLDTDQRPELILMAYFNPNGANSFNYRVGRNLNANGIAQSWTPVLTVPGVGWEGQGAAVAVGRIDNNPQPDVVFAAYDNPTGANSIKYRVGFNMNASGNANWSNTVHIGPGAGWEGQGLGAALVRADDDPRPDLMLMIYDNPLGMNRYFFAIGWNLDATGAAESWTPPFQLSLIPGAGPEARGAGFAVGCLGNTNRPAWFAMAYDHRPNHDLFSYMVAQYMPLPICP